MRDMNNAAVWTEFLKVPVRVRGEFIENMVEYSYTLFLRPGDVSLDIGAHRGRHTIPMARRVGPKGKVFAVEAAPEMRKKLRASINRADVKQIRNITTYLDYAVSDKPGSMPFNYVPKAAGLSGLREQEYPDGVEVIIETVEVRRIDDLIPSDTPLRFIKLDIEGAEYHALLGATALLRTARPMIVFEFGGPGAAQIYDYTDDDFFGMWSSLGYKLYNIFGQPYERENWGMPGPHCLFASPGERQEEAEALLRDAMVCSLSRMLAESDA